MRPRSERSFRGSQHHQRQRHFRLRMFHPLLRLLTSTWAVRRHRGASSRRLSAAVPDAKPKKHHKSHKRLTAKQIAWNIMGWFHWKARFQFKYLNWLWTRESSWNVYATNPYSGAYGIPQAVPAGKMSSCGSDWRTDAKTQIRWGMRYIRSSYGSPKQAWAHEIDDGWY